MHCEDFHCWFGVGSKVFGRMKQIVSGSRFQCQSQNPSCWRKNLGTASHKRIKLEEQSDRGRGEQSPLTGEDPYDGAVKLNGCILSHRTPPLGTY